MISHFKQAQETKIQECEISPINEIIRFDTYQEMHERVAELDIDTDYIWSVAEGDEEDLEDGSREQEYVYAGANHLVNVLYWIVADKPFEGTVYVEKVDFLRD